MKQEPVLELTAPEEEEEKLVAEEKPQEEQKDLKIQRTVVQVRPHTLSVLCVILELQNCLIPLLNILPMKRFFKSGHHLVVFEAAGKFYLMKVYFTPKCQSLNQ